MMNKTVLLLIISVLSFFPLDLSAALKWFNPADYEKPCIQQRGFGDELGNSYHRFPDRFKSVVPPLVWEKSTNSSGLAISFYTDASEINVRYQVSGPLNTPDMSTIGTSGCDLRCRDKDGEWHDVFMGYDFADTIKLAYRYLDTSIQHEYKLFLPLYNTVEWLEIGVPEQASFKVAAPRTEMPVVIYGTSICQGGDCSRAGNSWTNMLSTRLDWPVINFGFDGSGKLEKEVVDAISEVDASVYILDNLYNLTEFPVAEKYKRLLRAVHIFKAKHPDTPLIIVEHTGHNDTASVPQRDSSNLAVHKVLAQLQSEGVRDVLLLPLCGKGADGLGFTVEGVHLNDHGMSVVAGLYETALRPLLRLPEGTVSTTRSVTQRRMPQSYDWLELHTDILLSNRKDPPQNIILGDSIIHYWGGREPGNGRDSWDSQMATRGYANLGMAWDRIENILWRVNHGELDGFDAQTVIVEAGSNNIEDNSDDEIIEGVVFLLQSVRLHQPNARIKYMGILPCSPDEARIRSLNPKLRKAVREAGFEYFDCGKCLTLRNGNINRELFIDDAHPNENGYRFMCDAMFKQ